MMTSKSDVAPIQLLCHVLRASSIGGSAIDILGIRQARMRINTRSSSIGDNSCLASCFEGYIRAGRQTVWSGLFWAPSMSSYPAYSLRMMKLMSTEFQTWPLTYDPGPG